MFVHYLSERQQAALLHYSYEVMRIDNVADPSESVHLEVLRAQAREGVEAEDVPTSELADLFEDRMSGVVLLLELVGMGYVDESFSAAESTLVLAVASVLGLADDLPSIESWVKRQMLLVNEAREIMEG